MDLWERVRGGLEKGLSTSRDILGKAGEKARDLGEMGIVSLEIRQTEHKIAKKVAQLGTIVYEALARHGESSVMKDNREVADCLEEIERLEQQVAEKEATMKTLKQKNN